MRKDKDIFNSIPNKGPGFSVPKNYFEEFEGRFSKMMHQTKPGFTIPKDYFEQVEESVIHKVSSHPKVASAGFKTPDNYLENIDNEILNRIHVNKKTKVISINRNTIFRTLAYAVAASLLLFFGLKTLYPTDTNLNFDTLTIAQIEAWMEIEMVDINTYDIADTFADASFNLENSYSNEEILDYLDHADIENLILKD